MKAKLGKLAGDFGRLFLAKGHPDPLAYDLRDVIERGRLGADQGEQGLGAKLAVGLPLGHTDTRARVGGALTIIQLTSSWKRRDASVRACHFSNSTRN